MDEITVDVRNLSKQYGNFKAVDNISFAVKKGEIFGLLGPNGAGKTTTIKLLTTLSPPTSGNASVAGYDIIKQQKEVKRNIGWVSAEIILDDDLNAWENLGLQAALQGITNWEENADNLLKYFELAEFKYKNVGKFSTGMRKKLEIAMALLNSPEVIFMDEPTIGLDVGTRKMLWDLILIIKNEYKVTVFLTTHYMEEADQLCDRIAIISHGKIIALGSPTELKQKAGGYAVNLEVNDGFDISSLKNFHILEKNKSKILIEINSKDNMLDVLRSINLENLKSINLITPSLDSVFLKLTGSTIKETEESVDYRKFYSMVRRNMQ
ncbi:ATP-binding cassette domain-containing protein [Candidatus Parvarchaeota archaeon]|nr:ATP-binding cassette domain-containing protein [Candidatus Parvarchaeota archaeon]